MRGKRETGLELATDIRPGQADAGCGSLVARASNPGLSWVRRCCLAAALTSQLHGRMFRKEAISTVVQSATIVVCALPLGGNHVRQVRRVYKRIRAAQVTLRTVR